MRLIPRLKRRERRDDRQERTIAKLICGLMAMTYLFVATLHALATYEERKEAAIVAAGPEYDWKLERWIDEKTGLTVSVNGLIESALLGGVEL